MTPSLFAATATTPGTSLVSAAWRRTSSTTLSPSFLAPAADQDGVTPYFANETAADIAAPDFNSSRRVWRVPSAAPGMLNHTPRAFFRQTKTTHYCRRARRSSGVNDVGAGKS